MHLVEFYSVIILAFVFYRMLSTLLFCRGIVLYCIVLYCIVLYCFLIVVLY